MKKEEISQIEKIRHSLSHLMTMAIVERYPDTGLGVGPWIENGWYQDYDLNEPLTNKDFEWIEKRMRELIAQGIEFKQSFHTPEEALEMSKNDPYKTEIIQDLVKEGEKKISFYTSGDFVNLCAGPHVKNSNEINPEAFKLTNVAGAYWKGDEKNKMLTRIYGVAFETKDELDKYLERLEEAKKRDHRVLGEQLDLFMVDDEVGQGLILWLPKGALIRHKVMEFAFNTYLDKGYVPVSSPHIASGNLWKHSGHLDFYKESMYDSFGIDDEQYRLKPMNCPFHIKMYKRKKRSYRDLPFRYTEMGTVYRYEKSGTLHGLTRVRGFTQDDAHIICTPSQLHDELVSALKLTFYILDTFGFKDFEMNLSVRDPEHKEKFIGDDTFWKKAESELISAMKEVGYSDYVLDVGGAVFYGPKIDIKINDTLDRPWQLSTIQFDFNLPSRFCMSYVGKDGKEHTPFMIHRALLGSLERFIGILIEHYAGAFPIWLAPVQVAVMPVGSAHIQFAHSLSERLRDSGIRVEVDDANETIGNKIRKAENQKIPYMLVVGDKEMNSDKLAVRKRGKQKTVEMTVDEFIEDIKEKIAKRSLEL